MIGDGKLGLLVAQALVVQWVTGVVHFGKHEHKLSLVQGSTWEVIDDTTSSRHPQVGLHAACIDGCVHQICNKALRAP